MPVVRGEVDEMIKCRICNADMTEQDLYRNTTGYCRICHIEESVSNLWKMVKV